MTMTATPTTMGIADKMEKKRSEVTRKTQFSRDVKRDLKFVFKRIVRMTPSAASQNSGSGIEHPTEHKITKKDFWNFVREITKEIYENDANELFNSFK
jgi:predicted oxidoreductase (fatty acid repression mutant protein)